MQDFREYIGREQRASDQITLEQCRRAAALLDIDPQQLRTGDLLPLGWSTLLFNPVVRDSQLGADGHARLGEFLPAMPLPRRMLAGRSVSLLGPLRIGDCVEQVSRIANIEPKEGRDGPLIFATVRHELQAGEGTAVIEDQRVVYRGHETGTSGRKPAPTPEMPSPVWQERYRPTPAMLFRCSALTYNAHRIHYDLAYAREEEGYPDLVVNATLTTLKLMELAARKLPFAVAGYQTRAMRPMFCGREVTLCGAPSNDGAVFWAVDDTGATCFRIDIRSGA